MDRIGFGYDVHRFAKHRPLMLGGVEIPAAKGLAGHSDADVLLHAIGDALLGAAALGDLGVHFPDDNERFRDADSRKLVREIAGIVKKAGFTVANVDATVALQRPKLRSYIDLMRASIARTLSIDSTCVSVKATTTEGLGFVGREEGTAAWAVVLLKVI